MATIASRPPEAAISRIPAGVPALRAGQGRSFLWRRLHSLSGIVPVGAFLLEHFISNVYATNGPNAYNQQVKFLTSLPFVFWLEVLIIYIPILYHGLYGFYIWYRGEGNVGAYTYSGNWIYTAQRWSGGIAFVFMVYHTYTMRFTEPEIVTHWQIAFSKVQHALVGHNAIIAFYAIGIIAAAWHLGAGIFLFCAKWGIVTGEKARQRTTLVGVLIAAVFLVMGLASLRAFVTTPMQPAPEVIIEQSQQPAALNH